MHKSKTDRKDDEVLTKLKKKKSDTPGFHLRFNYNFVDTELRSRAPFITKTKKTIYVIATFPSSVVPPKKKKTYIRIGIRRAAVRGGCLHHSTYVLCVHSARANWIESCRRLLTRAYESFYIRNTRDLNGLQAGTHIKKQEWTLSKQKAKNGREAHTEEEKKYMYKLSMIRYVGQHPSHKPPKLVR